MKTYWWHNLKHNMNRYKNYLWLLETDRHATRVIDYMERANESIHWYLSFLRVIQDWKVESLDNFLKDLYSIRLSQDGVDRMVWLPSKTKGFRVKGYYKVLWSRNDLREAYGGKKLCLGIAFFTWITALEKILTDNLWRHDIVLMDWCCIVQWF